MITDPLFYALAIPAILITGLSKAGFGGAMGGLAVPLMSLVIAPAEAAGIMLPILCAMDAVGLRRFAGSFDWSIALRTARFTAGPISCYSPRAAN